MLISSVTFQIFLAFFPGAWKDYTPRTLVWLCFIKGLQVICPTFCTSQSEQTHPSWYLLCQPESQNEENKEQGLRNLFCKGPESKYIRLYVTYTLC